jgi:hypothetical protein
MRVRIYDVVTGLTCWTAEDETCTVEFFVDDDEPGECDCVRGDIMYEGVGEYDCGQERFVIVGYEDPEGKRMYIFDGNPDISEKLFIARSWNPGRPDTAFVAAGLITEEELAAYVPVAAEPEPVSLSEALRSLKVSYADDDFKDTLVNLTARFIRDVNRGAVTGVRPLHTRIGYGDSFTLAQAILDMQFKTNDI